LKLPNKRYIYLDKKDEQRPYHMKLMKVCGWR
jgi:hypothetical protein